MQIYWSGKKLSFAKRWIQPEAMPVAVVVGAGCTMCAVFCLYQLFHHPLLYIDKSKRLKGLEVAPYAMPYKPKLGEKTDDH